MAIASKSQRFKSRLVRFVVTNVEFKTFTWATKSLEVQRQSQHEPSQSVRPTPHLRHSLAPGSQKGPILIETNEQTQPNRAKSVGPGHCYRIIRTSRQFIRFDKLSKTVGAIHRIRKESRSCVIAWLHLTVELRPVVELLDRKSLCETAKAWGNCIAARLFARRASASTPVTAAIISLPKQYPQSYRSINNDL